MHICVCAYLYKICSGDKKNRIKFKDPTIHQLAKSCS